MKNTHYCTLSPTLLSPWEAGSVLLKQQSQLSLCEGPLDFLVDVLAPVIAFTAFQGLLVFQDYSRHWDAVWVSQKSLVTVGDWGFSCFPLVHVSIGQYPLTPQVCSSQRVILSNFQKSFNWFWWHDLPLILLLPLLPFCLKMTICWLFFFLPVKWQYSTAVA